jgi:hypothetical protein
MIGQYRATRQRNHGIFGNAGKMESASCSIHSALPGSTPSSSTTENKAPVVTGQCAYCENLPHENSADARSRSGLFTADATEIEVPNEVDPAAH